MYLSIILTQIGIKVNIFTIIAKNLTHFITFYVNNYKK